MKALSTSQKWGIAGLFAATAAVFAFALIREPFTYSSVCDKCGAWRDATDWQIPLTSITVFTNSTVSDSPLSRVVLENNIVPRHTHQWVFAGGSGNGILCAIGEGRRVWPTAKSEEFAAFVLMLHQNEQAAFRDRILKGSLDPHTSSLF